VLAEFPRAVDAVQCAVAVQERLGQVAADASEDRRLHFRIGIHLGDVALRGGDLLTRCSASAMPISLKVITIELSKLSSAA
jgi:class 3 adenylate cyclase